MPYYRALMDFEIPNVMSMTRGQMVDLGADHLRTTEILGAVHAGWLEPVPALNALGLDTSPRDTDWDNLGDLFKDMSNYAKEHPQAEFHCADDPGHGGRIPRFGWTAFYNNSEGAEVSKQWTITLPKMKESRPLLPVFMARWIETAGGRREMLQHLVEVARANSNVQPPEPVPRTIWERLTDE